MEKRVPSDLHLDPHAGKILPVVVIAVFNKSGEILFLKRGNNPYSGYWELAGGRLEFGEKLEEAALRELREETGIRPKSMAFVRVYETHMPNYHRLLFLFACVSGTNEVKLTEQSAYKWSTLLPGKVIPIVRKMVPDAKQVFLRR